MRLPTFFWGSDTASTKSVGEALDEMQAQVEAVIIFFTVGIGAFIFATLVN